MTRRKTEVFGLSFLDCICCGFGATILIYMILNSGASERAAGRAGAAAGRDGPAGAAGAGGPGQPGRAAQHVRAGPAAGRVTDPGAVHAAHRRRASSRRRSWRPSSGRRSRSASTSTSCRPTSARWRRAAKRLSGGLKSREVPGDKVRSFVGDGDRQYLTGLKVGGKRILFLVDASASMLADTIVNAVRRRLLPEADRVRADKWRKAVRAVDWLTTQIPRDAQLPDLRLRHRGARPRCPGPTAPGWRPATASRLEPGGGHAAQHRPRGRHQPREGLRRRRRAAAPARQHPAPHRRPAHAGPAPRRGAHGLRQASASSSSSARCRPCPGACP